MIDNGTFEDDTTNQPPKEDVVLFDAQNNISARQVKLMQRLGAEIVENAPQTAEAHSAQGEAIAGVNEKLEDHIRLLI